MKRIISATAVALTCWASASFGADVVVDNSTLPQAEISGVSWDPVTGRISITTTSGNYQFTQENPTGVISSFSVNPTNLTVGASVNIQWTTTQDAQSCTPTGTLPGWVGTTINTSGNVNLTQNSTGNFTAGIQCLDGQQNQDSRNPIAVSVNAANTVAITSFTVTPSTVTEGQSVTVSWSSTNATSCSAQGSLPGWTGSKGTSGSEVLSQDADGSYSARIFCSNATSNQTSQTISVTVNPGTPVGCPDTQITGSTISWASEFRGRQWPTISGRELVDVNRNQYKAIQFTTSNTPTGRNYIVTSPTTGTSSNQRVVKISDCPGDINPFRGPSNCIVGNSVGAIGWSTNNTAGTCHLETGKTYYLNIIFTSSALNPAANTCLGSVCQFGVEQN